MSTDQLIRLEALRKICFDLHLVKDTNEKELSPGKLGKLIERETNYCSDLLHGRRPFGEEIARHIEEKLGLPKWELDGGAGWPFPGIDRRRFDNLTRDERIEIQGLVRKGIEGFEAAQTERTRTADAGKARHPTDNKGKHPPTMQLFTNKVDPMDGHDAARGSSTPSAPSPVQRLHDELTKEGDQHDSNGVGRVESQGHGRGSKGSARKGGTGKGRRPRIRLPRGRQARDDRDDRQLPR